LVITYQIKIEGKLFQMKELGWQL